MDELFPKRDPVRDEQVLQYALAEEKARYPNGFSAIERVALSVLADDLSLTALVRRALLFAARFEPPKEKSTSVVQAAENSEAS